MEKADIEETFNIDCFKSSVSRLKWPMSVIRLKGTDKNDIINLAEYILSSWKNYSDESVDIINKTTEEHSTITPIARKKGNEYELDLVLRNNRTTREYPMGIFHPHNEVHHIKKENIGLIEVMGLAVLPSRLEEELNYLANLMINKEDEIKDNKYIHHNDWYKNTLKKYDVNNIKEANEILKEEVGKKFLNVLEHSGVFKRDKKGISSFNKFINSL